MTPEFYDFLQEVPEDERTGPVFNPRPNKQYTDRMLPSSISKVIPYIGEKANVVVVDVVVVDKGNIDKETGKRKLRYASAHDLRRSFGFRWSRRVKMFELKELMRHESIATTQEFYVEENAQDTARSIWASYDVDQRKKARGSSENTQNSEENPSPKELQNK